MGEYRENPQYIECKTKRVQILLQPSIYEAAKKQAEQIIKEAESKAKETVEELNLQITMKEKEIDDLKRQFDVYKAKMESLLISQLELIKDINNEE